MSYPPNTSSAPSPVRTTFRPDSRTTCASRYSGTGAVRSSGVSQCHRVWANASPIRCGVAQKLAVRRAQKGRHPFLVGSFVKGLLLEPYAKGVPDGRRVVRVDQGGHTRGVQTAAHVTADRHVRPQANANGIDEQVSSMQPQIVSTDSSNCSCRL